MSTANQGQECPFCEFTDTPTRIGGWDEKGRRLRQRQCANCRKMFVTVESVVLLSEGAPIPYSWLDEEYRLRQREAARARYTRKGGGQYRGLRTKRPIEGVASLDVTVKVKLPEGMRPDARHGTAEPVPNYRQEPSYNTRTLVPLHHRQSIVRRYLNGTPCATLAREYRISKRTIQRYVRRYGTQEDAA